MSDTGRQSFTDKLGSTLKPDSQKGVVEQTTDQAKGVADSAASKVQPEKSTTQRMQDTASGNKNEESMLDKAKGAMGMGSSDSK